MAFLRTSVIALTIHVRTMPEYLLLPSADIYLLLNALHNVIKYAPYLKWSRGEKSNCLVQMNTCALKLMIVEHDSVDFIFTWCGVSPENSLVDRNGKTKTNKNTETNND